jgi:hypothetical protein
MNKKYKKIDERIGGGVFLAEGGSFLLPLVPTPSLETRALSLEVMERKCEADHLTSI